MTELETLYSDHKALQEQRADVDSRLSDAKLDLARQIEQIKKTWEAYNAELLAEHVDVHAAADAKEAELRAAVVAAWPGGEAPKMIAPGLSVRVTQKPVYDEASAIQFAIDGGYAKALKLNAKEFEAIAKVLEPEFVKYEPQVSAVIK